MESNRHHIWFERKWYTSALDKQFRGYRGFVVPTAVQIHNNLHAVVKPPIKPSPALMRATLDHLGRFQDSHQDVLMRTVEYFDRVEPQDELQERNLQRLGANILAQCDILFNAKGAAA